MATWQTTVGEVVGIFRDALIGVLPAIERARIAWRSPDAYDDWDLVADALYRAIVVESIVWSLGDPSAMETLAHDIHDNFYRSPVITPPRYGLGYLDYGTVSYVGVEADSSADQPSAAFHSFETSDEAFDSVTAWIVGASEPTPITLPWSEARFHLRHRLTDGSLRRWETLAVEVPER